MKLIYVMRHAQSEVNVKRILTGRLLTGDLTDLGREQAAKAAEWLADKQIEQVIHSPFHRTTETANIVCERLHLQSTLNDDLREMDGGSLDGLTDEPSWAAFYAVYERWLQGDWNARYPNGESYREGYDRFRRCLLAVDPEKTTLLITHGGICNSVIPYLCVNAAALQGKRTLDNTGIIVLEPYGDGRFICRAWNQIDHLQTV